MEDAQRSRKSSTTPLLATGSADFAATPVGARSIVQTTEIGRFQRFFLAPLASLYGTRCRSGSHPRPRGKIREKPEVAAPFPYRSGLVGSRCLFANGDQSTGPSYATA
jgi:hypothetical protein